MEQAPWTEILEDTRGGMSAEYVVTLAMAGAVIALALLASGDMTVLSYQNARDLLMVPAQ